MNNNVMLVDGQNIAHIVYNVHKYITGEEMRAPDGEPTTVLKGTLNTLGSILGSYGPQQIVIGYDGKHPSWRFDRDPGYKGGIAPRSSTSMFGSQLERLPHHLAAFGINCLQTNTLEGDDIVALLATHPTLANKKKLMVSDDKDLLAFITNTTFCYSSKIKTLVTPTNFNTYTQKLGKFTKPVGINGWPLFRALVGDTSDAIKGVPGCGPVYAAELIGALGEKGIKLTGHAQAYKEIEPQLKGVRDEIEPKLKVFLSDKNLPFLQECYELVRVANSPEAEQQEVLTSNIDPIQVTTESITKKLEELGFEQWLTNDNWKNRFVLPLEVQEELTM